MALFSSFLWLSSIPLCICTTPSFLFFFFILFWGSTWGMWRFPGHGSNQCYSCWRIPQPQKHLIRATSVTYTTDHGNARSLTHWARAGIEPSTTLFLVGFVNHWATTGTPDILFYFILFLFFVYTQGIWKFLGQGLNLSHSCSLCCSYGNARAFNHCTKARN